MNSDNTNHSQQQQQETPNTTTMQQVLEKQDLARHMAEFWDAHTLLHTTSLVCKSLLAWTRVRARDRLTGLVAAHNADDDFMDRIHIELMNNFVHLHGNNNVPTEWPARLQLACAYTIPVKRRVTALNGLTAVLPQSGNIVSSGNENDGLIRIMDPHDMRILDTATWSHTPGMPFSTRAVVCVVAMSTTWSCTTSDSQKSTFIFGMYKRETLVITA